MSLIGYIHDRLFGKKEKKPEYTKDETLREFIASRPSPSFDYDNPSKDGKELADQKRFLDQWARNHPVSFDFNSLTKEEREQLSKDIEETGKRARLREFTNHGGCFPHPMSYFEEPRYTSLRRFLNI